MNLMVIPPSGRTVLRQRENDSRQQTDEDAYKRAAEDVFRLGFTLSFPYDSLAICLSPGLA